MAETVHTGRLQAQESHHVELPGYVRVSGTFVRSVFIVTLIAITWSISMPSTVTKFAHFSTGDTVRAIIGLAMCIGMVRQLLRLPKDAGAYRTWVHIGLSLAFVLAVFVSLRLALAA
jgi:uncharacterized membrane protein YdbT with pleckstrin-like domain